MLTPLEQKRVWENMLAAEIRADYFAALATSYRLHQRIANWATLVLSSGAALSLLLDLPPDYKFVRLGLALATTCISAYSVVAQNYDRANAALDLHARWNKLAKGATALWDRMDDTSARDDLQEIEDLAGDLSKAGIAFPNKKRQMLKWQNLVEQHHAADCQAQ